MDKLFKIALLLLLAILCGELAWFGGRGRYQCLTTKSDLVVVDTATGTLRIIYDGKWQELDTKPKETKFHPPRPEDIAH